MRGKGLKRCPQCKNTKKLDEFYDSGLSNNGKASHCKICSKILEVKFRASKEERHEKYMNRREQVFAAKLKRKFGITIEEYNLKLNNQDYKCAICEKTNIENGKNLAVDHCHKTGKVRDLLCANCNAAVGFVNENPIVAEKIAIYIRKWKE